MRIAHRVLGAQVGMGVADLRIVRLRPKPLQLPLVLAILDRGGIGKRVDRLTRYPHMQTGQIAFFIDARRQTALRDGPIEIMSLVFFTRPHHFHRYAGEGFGNGHALPHHVLVADAPAETATQIHYIGFAFFQRQARCT